MATAAERLAIVETKVENLDEKIDHLQGHISSNHTNILETLKSMREESTVQHNELAGKVKDLQSVKDKWMKYGMVFLAFAAGAGWLKATATFPQVIKLLGL